MAASKGLLRPFPELLDQYAQADGRWDVTQCLDRRWVTFGLVTAVPLPVRDEPFVVRPMEGEDWPLVRIRFYSRADIRALIDGLKAGHIEVKHRIGTVSPEFWQFNGWACYRKPGRLVAVEAGEDRVFETAPVYEDPLAPVLGLLRTPDKPRITRAAPEAVDMLDWLDRQSDQVKRASPNRKADLTAGNSAKEARNATRQRSSPTPPDMRSTAVPDS